MKMAVRAGLLKDQETARHPEPVSRQPVMHANARYRGEGVVRGAVASRGSVTLWLVREGGWPRRQDRPGRS